MSETAATVSMNGLACLRCSLGWYDGYDGQGKTRPCPQCGHQAPAKMTRADLALAIQKRNDATRVKIR